MNFYMFTYWLLESAVSRMDEDKKNLLFVDSFFKTQDITIKKSQNQSNIYGMKILKQESDFILGQIGATKSITHHKDDGNKYITEEIIDNPYLYFFVDVRKGRQKFYIEATSNSPIYSTINSLKQNLNKFAQVLCPTELEVNFEYHIEEVVFEKEVSQFDLIQSVSVTMKPRNFLLPGSETEINKIVNDFKADFNSNEVTLGLRNKNGLIKEKFVKFREMINWINKKAGTWKMSGIRNNSSYIRKKEDIISKVGATINDNVLDDSDAFLKALKSELINNDQ